MLSVNLSHFEIKCMYFIAAIASGASGGERRGEGGERWGEGGREEEEGRDDGGVNDGAGAGGRKAFWKEIGRKKEMKGGIK